MNTHIDSPIDTAALGAVLREPEWAALSPLDAIRAVVTRDASKATLQDTVRVGVEKQQAERAAWQAPGVLSVDNQISVTL